MAWLRDVLPMIIMMAFFTGLVAWFDSRIGRVEANLRQDIAEVRADLRILASRTQAVKAVVK